MMYYLLAAIALIYVLVLVVMGVFQRKFLYFPDKNIGSPEQYGLFGFTEGFIRTPDEISLQTWYKEAKNDLPTIIYFHGNASHIGNRAGIYSALAEKGFGVFAVSYRGYGKSQGSPTEQGLYIDARTAINNLLDVKNIPLSKIIIYGESLGTGVAVQMGTEYNVGAVILQAPYTSVVGRAAEIYFFLPAELILLDKFDSLRKIKGVKSPLMIIHGELDEVIPIRHGKTLFEAANHPKESVFFHDVAHNNFDSSLVALEICRFIKIINSYV